MKFLKGFLVFILLAIIIGGVGYIGYSFLFMNHSNMSNMPGMTSSQPSQTDKSIAATNETAQGQQSMQGMQGMNGTQQGSSANQTQQTSSNQVTLDQANTALQNKDKLGKSIATLNEALRLMSVDPYAPSSSTAGSMTNMQPQQGTASGVTVQGNTQTGNTTPATTQGNNTTINIYPQNNNSAAQSNGMQNMGTTYDANKMEQLHAGLYKISVGMALLGQLNDELVSQAEYANTNLQNPLQYYSNQYSLTVQDKNKLSQAFTYINEAANLININPYLSSNGLVYDKDRMNQLHQSVFKLAEGVASLNQLSDDFTRQSIYLSNTVQNYINNANSTMNMPMNMSSSLFGGLFDNIKLSTVVNILLALFAIGLIFGIFGFIFSLLKPPAQKAAQKEDQTA